MTRALALAALLAFGLAGCRKARPSPQYLQASMLYESLKDRLGDEAYAEPEMTQVEGLLEKVDSSSADAQKASELKAAIASDRVRVARESAERQKAIADAVRAPEGFHFSEPLHVEQPPAAAVEVAPDGGAAAPVPGMSERELNARFSRCFEGWQEISIDGHGMRGTYRLKDLGVCRDLFPAFTSSVLIIEDSKVLAMVPQSAITTTIVPNDAGPPQPQPAPEADAGGY